MIKIVQPGPHHTPLGRGDLREASGAVRWVLLMSPGPSGPQGLRPPSKLLTSGLWGWALPSPPPGTQSAGPHLSLFLGPSHQKL